MLFILGLLLASATLFIGEKSWLMDSGAALASVSAVVFIEFLILIFLIVGLANIFNGREEFDSEHESNIILATILLIVFFVLFLISIVSGKGFFGGVAFVAAASTQDFVGLAIVLGLSIAWSIIFGLAMTDLIKRLASEEQKKKMKKAFYLLVAGNFTLNITSIIAYYMFFKVYQEMHLSLKEGRIKAAVTAPCPQCDKHISIESKVCPHCGAKFDESNKISIDPRLTMDAPKSEYSVPAGYAPIKGPSEEEKKKLFRFIKIIIGVVVIVVVLYLVIRFLLGA